MELYEFLQYLTPETLASMFVDIGEVIRNQGGLDAGTMEARDTVMDFVVQPTYFTNDERTRFMCAVGEITRRRGGRNG